jgi:hypothetical protein
MSVNDLLVDNPNKGWSNLYVNSITVYNDLDVQGSVSGTNPTIEGVVGVAVRDEEDGAISTRELQGTDLHPVLVQTGIMKSVQVSGENTFTISKVTPSDIEAGADNQVLTSNGGSVNWVTVPPPSFQPIVMSRGNRTLFQQQISWVQNVVEGLSGTFTGEKITVDERGAFLVTVSGVANLTPNRSRLLKNVFAKSLGDNDGFDLCRVSLGFTGPALVIKPFYMSFAVNGGTAFKIEFDDDVGLTSEKYDVTLKIQKISDEEVFISTTSNP